MDSSDQIIYVGCWVVLVLYIVTTLLVFILGSCVSCAASFLFACILAFDMALFNAWFLLPAFDQHIRDIALMHSECRLDYIRHILTCSAAGDIYLLMFGSFGSWLAVFNAGSMLQTEGCIAMPPHEHGKLAGNFVKAMYRIRDYLRLQDYSTPSPSTIEEGESYPDEKKLLLAS
ncbi:hypothetical protein GGS21DRAFT_53025 [Xylaria nigripes]|nr:hypothetical protein GGS21DRAFT_53025 [Xylaria nigripes]